MKKQAAVPVPGLVLGIETATALGGVAVVDGAGRLLGEVTLFGRESHSERIIPEAGRLLQALGAAPADLAAVSVSSGPGSFTGLRTGVASAKGLAFARAVPLFGVPTLEVLAANAPAGCGLVCAVLNARRGEVYRALFEAGDGGPRRLTPDELVVADHALAGLPGECLLLGELPPGPARPQGAGLRFAAEQCNHPRAAVVALIGLRALRSGRKSELASLAPRYLRASDAAVCARPTVAPPGPGAAACVDTTAPIR